MRHRGGMLDDVIGLRAVHQHDDTGAFPTTHHVRAAAERTGNRARHALDHGVTAGAVEDLVVRPQLVDVEQQQRDVGLVPLRQREIALEHVLEVVARRQAGEPVLAHPVRQAADARLAVGTMARAAFAVIPDEVRDLPVAVLEWIDLHVVDEHRAVLADIAQQRARGLEVAQRVAQRDQLRLLAIVALHHAQVLAQQLVGLVTGELAECAVDVDHEVIAAGFADGDALGSDVEHGTKESIVHVHALPAVRFRRGAAEEAASSSWLARQASPASSASRSGAALPRMRTSRRWELGWISQSSRSSSVATDLRSLQTGSTSQPASSAAVARATMSPYSAAPPMERSSVNTAPSKRSSSRSAFCTQRRERLAGSGAIAGNSTCATITPGRPLAIRRRYGTRSSWMPFQSRLSTGSDLCESAVTAPCPGKCLAVAAMPASFMPCT